MGGGVAGTEERGCYGRPLPKDPGRGASKVYAGGPGWVRLWRLKRGGGYHLKGGVDNYKNVYLNNVHRVRRRVVPAVGCCSLLTGSVVSLLRRRWIRWTLNNG